MSPETSKYYQWLDNQGDNLKGSSDKPKRNPVADMQRVFVDKITRFLNSF